MARPKRPQRTSLPGPLQAVPFASAAGMLAGVAVDRALHAEATGLPSGMPGAVAARA